MPAESAAWAIRRTVKIADADQVIDADATGSDAKVSERDGRNGNNARIDHRRDRCPAQQTAFSTNRPAMTTTQSFDFDGS